jgi:4-amino-4-deoxychorismate lyase
MSGRLGIWIDGRPGDSVPSDDRGLQYGDGLFETMRVRKRQVRFLDAHLARLLLGCERLGIPAPDAASLRGEIASAAETTQGEAILKLLVTRGSGPRGYAARGLFTARRVLSLFAAPAPSIAAEGVALRIAGLTVAEQPRLAGLKHLNRLENVLAASEPGHENCFEALLLDTAGQVVGGTMSNVFLIREGSLVTPPVDRAGVAGVLRSIVLRESGKLGLRHEVRNVPGGELRVADEVFVTNARIGVVPVRSVGEHSYTMNGITTRIAAHVEALDA